MVWADDERKNQYEQSFCTINRLVEYFPTQRHRDGQRLIRTIRVVYGAVPIVYFSTGGGNGRWGLGALVCADWVCDA